jgi:hypothetical protein
VPIAWRDRAQEWVSSNRQVVEETFQEFLRSGEWPRIHELQRDLDRRGIDGDVELVARAKPTSVGVTGDFGPADLTLQIRHLVHIEAATQLVTVCVNAIKLAEARYLDHDEQPRVIESDAITRFPFDASGALRLRAFKVLTIDRPSPFGGSSQQGRSWTLDIDTRTARLFRGVTTATGFIEHQDELASRETLRMQPTPGSGESHARTPRQLLFLSWSGAQSKGIAESLMPVLAGRLPGVEVFFSPESIDPGADPSRALYEESLIPARALVVVLTPESAKSAYVIWETAAAWGRQQLVIPIFAGLGPDNVPGPLSTKVEGVFIEDRTRVDRALSVIAQEFGVPEVEPLTDEEWGQLSCNH